MSVNGLSFPTMTNKVNILITISTYETAQLITANHCQSLRDLRSRAIKDRSNHCQPMPITANHDPKKLIKIVIKMLTLFVMVDNGRQ